MPPTIDQLYVSLEEKEYNPELKPFAVVTSRNLNQLTSAVINDSLEFPDILNNHPSLVFSEELKFKTKELKVNIEKEYPFLS